MATTPTTALLRHIRKLAATPDADRQLLQRYIDARDEAAFAALVERHGHTVRSVCRSVLRHEQDAEDAFQATFLVLARTAPSIRKQQSLGSWLHGVAYRLSLKMQRRAARQRRRDQRAAPRAATGTMDDLSWRELRGLLHEELHRLPERYRAPLLLCYWEGKTRDEAAVQLGWTKGTLKERLERGRALLRDRLTRRGVIPSAALFATLLAEHAAEATLPAALVQATTHAALQAGASATATALARGALRTTRLARWALLLVLGVAVSGMGAMLYRALDVNAADERDEPPAAVPVAKGRPRPQLPVDPLPTGAVAQFGSTRLQDASIDRCASFSPDGKQLATAGSPVCIWDAATGQRVATVPLNSSVYDLRYRSDGTLAVLASFGNDSFVMREFTPGKPADPRDEERLRAEAGERERKGAAPAPERGRLYHSYLAADGRSVVAIRNRADKAGQWAEIYPFTPAQTSNTVKPVTRVDLPAGYGTWLSHDGRWLLAHVEPATHNGMNRLVAFDLTARTTDKPAWTLDVGERVERRPVTCLTVRGSPVVIRFFDGTVECWDGPAGKRIRRLPSVPMFYLHSNGEWGGIDLSADGKHLALLPRGRDGAVGGQVVEVATGKQLASLQPGPMPRSNGNTCFSPDGRRVARVAYGVVRIWNADTGADACPLPGHRGAVLSVAPADGGRLIVSTGEDFTVRGWDPDTGTERWSTVLPDITSVKFMTADAAIVAEDQRWGYDELAACIDLATGARKPLPGKLGMVKSPVPLAITPDGKRIVTLNRERKPPSLDVWSWPAGESLAQVPLQPPGKLALSYCGAAHFTPDGKQLIAGMYYDDPSVPLGISRLPPRPFIERWDLAAGKLLERFEASPDHPPHLLAHRNGVLLWGAGRDLRDAITRKLIAELEIPPDAGILLAGARAALSPDGKQLAIGESSRARDGGHRVGVLDVATGKLVRTLTVPSADHSYLRGLRFLPDGRLITLGETAIVWPAGER